MTQANCKEIRRELDELMLDDDYGVRVSTHLRECSECRDFEEKHIKLRQIVGSLGTVAAPADFDFKLRARLANENRTSSFHFSSLFGFGQRTAAIATALVLLVAAIVFAGYWGTKKTRTETIAGTPVSAPHDTPPSPLPKPSEVVTPKQEAVAGIPAQHVTSTDGRTNNNKSRIKTRQLASTEFSSQVAPRITPDSSTETEQVFPIDASQQSLRVSLFDKKGNPKTISLPPVSFGSQRVVPTVTSYAPKGVW